jgi:ParB family transcriptional regulator, chromosome partitioning protein
MELRHIPFPKLKLSPLNMRHARRAPDVSDILPSVRTRGVLVPLLVRPDGKSFEVVAGRRRWFAAKVVVKERGRIAPLPCGVLAPGDDAAALEASMIENLHRLDPDPMSQYESFARLTAEGRSVGEIAATFGLKESQVKQRLAIGSLLPAIRDAYRAEDIDAETLQVLTMASKAQQQDWLKLFEDAGSHAPRGSELKRWLFGGESIPTKAAIFPLSQYKGEIITDLFGEGGYFADTAQFWDLQNKAIAEARERYLANGWAVEVLEIGKLFHEWEHQKIAKKKGGRVYIATSHQGDVSVYEGYLPAKEARRLAKKKGKETKPETTATGVAPAHPAMTQALQNYLELHRHAVVRLALVAHPGTAFRLMVAHAIAASGHWRVAAEPQTAKSEAIAASLKQSAAQQAFDQERAAVTELLALPEDETVSRYNGDGYRTAAVFARLLTLTDKQVSRIAAFVMAETLAAGSAVVEALGVHLKADPAQHWTPDDAFFDLVRDKASVNAMLAEVCGKAVADANVAERAKVQKQIIRDTLAGANGRSKVAGWLPGTLAFPFRDYGDGSHAIAQAAGSVAALFPG